MTVIWYYLGWRSQLCDAHQACNGGQLCSNNSKFKLLASVIVFSPEALMILILCLICRRVPVLITYHLVDHDLCLILKRYYTVEMALSISRQLKRVGFTVDYFEPFYPNAYFITLLRYFQFSQKIFIPGNSRVSAEFESSLQALNRKFQLSREV